MKKIYSFLCAALFAGTAMAQTVVGNESLTCDMTVGGPEVVLPFDLGATTAALGAAPTVEMFDLVTETGYDAVHTANTGFWLTADGKSINWGEGAVYFIEYRNDSNFYLGQFGGALVAGNEYKVKVAFVNEDKAYCYDVTVRAVGAAPVELTVVGEPQNLAPQLVLNTTYVSTAVEYDRDAVQAALGVAPAEAKFVAQNVDGSFIDIYTANNGYWFTKEGNVGNYGDNSGLFIESAGGNLTVGMFPSGIAVGDKFTAKVGYAHDGKVSMIVMEATVVAPAHVELTVVGDGQTLAPELVKQDYTATVIDFDKTVIETALGVTVDQAQFVAQNTDGTFSDTPNGNGQMYWFNKEGNVAPHGDNSSLYVDANDRVNGKLGIGQFPGLTVGDKYTVKVGFAHDGKVSIVVVDATIVAPAKIEYQVVTTIEKQVKLVLNSNYSKTNVEFDVFDVEDALGINTMEGTQFIARNVDGEFVTVFTGGQDEFWFNKEGDTAGWGNDSGLFVNGSERNLGILGIGMFPEGIGIGDTFEVKVGIASGAKVAVIVIKATITDENGNTGVGEILYDAAGHVNVYNTQGIEVKHGVEKSAALDNLPAGLYIVGGKKYVIK